MVSILKIVRQYSATQIHFCKIFLNFPPTNFYVFQTIWPCSFLLRAMNLTARNRPILEQRTNHQLVKNFPVFYRNRNFITVYTKADNSPYCASTDSSQYTTMLLLYDPFHYYVPSRTRSWKWSLSFRLLHEKLLCMSSLTCVSYVQRSWFHQLSLTSAGNYIYKGLHYVIISVLLSLVHSSTPSIRNIYAFLRMGVKVSHSHKYMIYLYLYAFIWTSLMQIF